MRFGLVFLSVGSLFLIAVPPASASAGVHCVSEAGVVSACVLDTQVGEGPCPPASHHQRLTGAWISAGESDLAGASAGAFGQSWCAEGNGQRWEMNRVDGDATVRAAGMSVARVGFGWAELTHNDGEPACTMGAWMNGPTGNLVYETQPCIISPPNPGWGDVVPSPPGLE